MAYEQTIHEKIQQRRYQILVHSYIYYQLGDNIVSDYVFDAWCRELVELQAKYPKESSEVKFYEDFKDFEGSSGFDLPYSMPDIQARGNRLLKYHEENDL